MATEFNFENVIASYGLQSKRQQQLPYGKTRRWIASMIGTGAAWDYVAQQGDTLLLRVAEQGRGRAGCIDFNARYLDFRYKPDGEFIPDEQIWLTGDEFLDQGGIFRLRRAPALGALSTRRVSGPLHPCPLSGARRGRAYRD